MTRRIEVVNDISAEDFELRFRHGAEHISVTVDPSVYVVGWEGRYSTFQADELEALQGNDPARVARAREVLVEFITPLLVECNPGWTAEQTRKLRTDNIQTIIGFFVNPLRAEEAQIAYRSSRAGETLEPSSPPIRLTPAPPLNRADRRRKTG